MLGVSDETDGRQAELACFIGLRANRVKWLAAPTPAKGGWSLASVFLEK